jgi:hypothetical protein
VKTCSECKRKCEDVEVLCPACGSVLEEKNYLKFIYWTTGLALATVYGAKQLGLITEMNVLAVFVLEAGLLLAVYPASKLIVKIRQPNRPVCAEMGSVFSPRYDRILIMSLMTVIALAATGTPPIRVALGRVTPGTAWFVAILKWEVFLGSLAAMLAMLVDQGLSFFDLRIANTYRHRATRGTMVE